VKTLRQMLDRAHGSMQTDVGWVNEPALADLVGAWLNQDEVQELLVAAWDPALVITRHDHGVTETPYDDPEIGEGVLRSRDITLETVVRGQVHGITLGSDPDREPPELLLLMHEQALRHHLVEVAIGKVRRGQ